MHIYICTYVQRADSCEIIDTYGADYQKGQQITRESGMQVFGPFYDRVVINQAEREKGEKRYYLREHRFASSTYLNAFALSGEQGKSSD